MTSALSTPISSLELRLQQLFDVPPRTEKPENIIRHLGAFWPHWALHKRTCDLTKQEIVSVFGSECPYPVWHKDEWFKNANPPKATFDFNQPFFPQAEKLFKQCPIAHNSGTHNENCEYTDDWWSSKNCYLCHTGAYDEDGRYNYRTIHTKNCNYCAFTTESENCIDLVNGENCFGCVYGLYLKNCKNSNFCYDCRNCSDCLFCFNMRNKRYCIGNQQLSKEQFKIQKKQFEYTTLSGYNTCKDLFQKMMREIAWHRGLIIDRSENISGDYITGSKDMENAFLIRFGEDGFSNVRGLSSKTIMLCLCPVESEKIYLSVTVKSHSYDIRCSFQLTESRFVDYSGYSAQIENCFGCCGLVRGKNCIMNTPYSAQEYSALKQRIVDHMKSTGEWGHFFPGTFAPNPYDESWSSFYFPLSQNQQQSQGYFSLSNPEKQNTNYLPISALPTTAQDATQEITKQTYWDDVAKKPFQILAQDINLCRELEVALPHTYYMRRIQENFRWMPYNGTLRETTCAKSGIPIQTSWPSEYDGRILSEEEYLKIMN